MKIHHNSNTFCSTDFEQSIRKVENFIALMTWQHSILSGWTNITRSIKYNFDLEGIPLEIKTNSQERVDLWFYNSEVISKSIYSFSQSQVSQI